MKIYLVYFPLFFILVLVIWWLPVFLWRNNEKWRSRAGIFLFIVNFPFYYLLIAPAFFKQPHFSTWMPKEWSNILHWIGGGILGYGILISLWTILPKIKAGGPGYKPNQLLRKGAFAIVRHPQLSGSFAISLGLSCWQQATYHLYLNAAYFLILLAQSWMEEKFLLVPQFGEEYREYRKTTKAFIPFLL